MKHLRFPPDEPSDESLINLTPLIDVVFVVLIMFILIAPMVEVDRVQLAEGAHSEKQSPSSTQTISIHVRADNSIYLNKREVTPQELEAALRALNTNTTPQLFHDKEARFGTFQMVKNGLERAGFHNVDIVLAP